jgi:hypothetical protein
MTRTFARRVLRTLAATNEAMARSQRVIWCFEPEKMPAMIDLLIAQGRLSESDRPHCVHWTTFERALSQEEIEKGVDADEMLDEAGNRTLTAEAWDALMQSGDALKAFVQARYGELRPDDISEIDWTGRCSRSGRLGLKLPSPRSTRGLEVPL